MRQLYYWTNKLGFDADPDLSNFPVLYVLVKTPRDQAVLHRELAILGYCPVLLVEDKKTNLWRFHHPDGERPL